MLTGQDLLTADANPVHWYSGTAHRNTFLDSRTNLGHRLRGLGALGAQMDDTVAGPGTGVILEFRSAVTHVPHGEWRDFALRTHRFITFINAAAANGRIDMRAPAPVAPVAPLVPVGAGGGAG